MNDTHQSIIESIEAYLTGTVTVEERSRIEKKITIDTEWKRIFNEERSLRDALGDDKSRDFILTSSQAIQRTQKSQKRSKGRVLNMIMSIAAAGAVLVVCSILLNNNSTSSQELFDEFFEEYPIVTTQRGDTQSNTLEKAYQADDWQVVLDELENNEQNSINSQLKSIYLSMAYLHQQESQKAIEILTDLNNSNLSPDYADLIQWYLALAHLQNGNRDKCKSFLTSLKKQLNKNSNLYKRVNSLLDDL